MMLAFEYNGHKRSGQPRQEPSGLRPAANWGPCHSYGTHHPGERDKPTSCNLSEQQECPCSVGQLRFQLLHESAACMATLNPKSHVASFLYSTLTSTTSSLNPKP